MNRLLKKKKQITKWIAVLLAFFCMFGGWSGSMVSADETAASEQLSSENANAEDPDDLPPEAFLNEPSQASPGDASYDENPGSSIPEEDEDENEVDGDSSENRKDGRNPGAENRQENDLSEQDADGIVVKENQKNLQLVKEKADDPDSKDKTSKGNKADEKNKTNQTDVKDKPDDQEQTENASGVPDIVYNTHVQTYGWQGDRRNGAMSGTVGKAKRLEGIRIHLENTSVPGSVSYSVHIQSYGWQDARTDGAEAGTTGQAKRLEAIRISLTGELAEKYDIYYRVQAETFGWLTWTKNGESAGTAGLSKRLEAIQIILTPKGTEPDYAALDGLAEFSSGTKVTEAASYVNADIQYRTHVQSYGWQNSVLNGGLSGTVGQAKRLEGIEIRLANSSVSGGVRYMTHVQSYGWQDWKEDGAVSGTVGQSKRLEAIRISLTGEISKVFDVYYRVQAQTYGWLGWTKNGGYAGTAGAAKRLEAIQIVLVPKGALPDTAKLDAVAGVNASVKQTPGTGYVAKNPEPLYRAHVQSYGWENWIGNGSLAGHPSEGKRLEAFAVRLDSSAWSGSISYRSDLKGKGWQDWAKDGAVSGTTGQNQELLAVEMKLSGEVEEQFNVYYSVYLHQTGWTEWTTNGKTAGNPEGADRIEGMRIVVLQKGTDLKQYLLRNSDPAAVETLNRIGWSLEKAYSFAASLSYSGKTVYTEDWGSYALAQQAFQNGTGNCYVMAAAFYELARVMDYEVYQIAGFIPLMSGGETAHSWCEIVVNGNVYVCDPNLTQSRGNDAYMKPYGSAGIWMYQNYHRMMQENP